MFVRYRRPLDPGPRPAIPDRPPPTSAAAPAIQAMGLVKSYARTPAVRGIDMRVEAGEVFGFLGPNGAGKTTTIAMLCTLTAPTAGRAWVAGHDVAASPGRVRRAIGLVFQESILDEGLTAWENLRFHARLYRVPAGTARARAETLLDLVGLSGRQNDLVRTFSGGMKRRLEIVRGMLHHPSVLFLDEPTIGLDPQTRAQIWDYLRELRHREGTTLFLTTHYLDEAEQSDRLAIIDDGRIIVEGTPAELKTVTGTDRVQISTSDDHTAAAQISSRFALPITLSPAGIVIEVDNGPAFTPRLCAGLDIPIDSVSVIRPSLDDVFLHYTGRSIRDQGRAPR